MFLLLILLLLMCLALFPTWPYSRTWGYYPTGLSALLLIVLLVILLCGWLPWGFYY